MGQHKKSKSWSTLISLPTMLTPSSSSGTRQTCLPADTTSSNNLSVDQDGGHAHNGMIIPSTISMKKSSSQQQYTSRNYGISSGNDNDGEINLNNTNNKELDNRDINDGGIDSNTAFQTLPLFYLFSSDALADEYAKEDTIIPFMEPPTLALDQATLIAGVLESLVRVVDDIPTSITDDDGSSGALTNDTEHEEQDTDRDDDDGDDDDDDDDNDEIDGRGVDTFDMDQDDVHTMAATDTWEGNNIDKENGLGFNTRSSSPENLQPSSPTGSSTGRPPFTIPSYTDIQQQKQHLSSIPTQHAYPKPSTSTLSSTSTYTLRNSDHHHHHRHRHYHSDLPPCPFTIIGLGSFKVALWPSVLNSFSGNQDLNLVVLVSPIYPDDDIIDILYKMEKSLNHALSSEPDTSINAQLIGQYITPLVRTSFTVE
ncbi:hypothetical protein BCR42DRAFT_43471 [Absidia repens]|uniref:Uncharacterized protein n=1 Tax=Absidia repens TaxID=90262 RepID=A0A1X2IGB1_9FUNG|nr:hypothetical protein BCR42DRAFT_43471 [Absidia repens]